jgi:GntR family transcriptional regulator
MPTVLREVQVPIETPRAQYRQLAELLRAAIERGDYAPGTLLDSETALAARYDVDRRTVNRAVLILRADGLVRVERGRGTIVRELPMLYRDAITRQRDREQGGARGAFGAEMERLGLTARSDVEIAEAPAPDDVAELLGIAAGATALTRRRRMYANDVPVQLATSWLPIDIAGGTQLAEKDTGVGGLYSRLADLGHAPALFREVVRVQIPDDDQARALRLDTEQRVFMIRRTARDAAGRVVEVNDITLPAHQWELASEWSAE